MQISLKHKTGTLCAGQGVSWFSASVCAQESINSADELPMTDRAEGLELLLCYLPKLATLQYPISCRSAEWLLSFTP